MKHHHFVLTGTALYLFFLLFAQSAFSQAPGSGIRGLVENDRGEPLEGVTVQLIQNANERTVTTNSQGLFSFERPDTSSKYRLLISYIGFLQQTLERDPLGSQQQEAIHIVMQPAAGQMQDVVVTALGITSKKRALGYSVQEIKGDVLTQARETNLVNSLAGRIAGVNIINGSNSMGGSSKIVIRGETSLAGTNQPLFVVDGTPIDNSVMATARPISIPMISKAFQC